MRNRNPKVSVIVPIYKVEKYLNKCIKSILDQTFEDFECILVDDGSPDRCGVICEEYAKIDDRISVIHKENGGVSSARNRGLEYAKGTFVVFADPDDYLEKNMFKTLVEKIEAEGVDVVICAASFYDENNNFLTCRYANEKKYSRQELLYEIFESPTHIGGACWNKIFRNDKQVFFDESLAIAEDTMFLFEYFNKSKAGYQIKESLYNVVERNSSATRINKMKARYDIIKGFEVLLRRAKTVSKELESRAIDKLLDTYLINLIYIKNNSYDISMQEATKMKQKISVQMLKIIIFAYIKRSLQRNKLNGYLFELFNVWIRRQGD